MLAGPDGREYYVKDEDEFAEAVERGWITDAEANGAREGLGELLDILKSGSLLELLNGVCPFGDVRDVKDQPPPRKTASAYVPLLHRDHRGRHFGSRTDLAAL